MKPQGLSIGIRLMIGTLVLISVLVILAATQLTGLHNLSGSLGNVIDGQAAMRTALSTQKAVVEMEAGLQEYLRTGKDKHLDQYRRAANAAQSGFEQWKSLVARDPDLAKRVDAARETFSNWRKKAADPAIASRGAEEKVVTPLDQASGTSGRPPVESLAELKTRVINLTETQVGPVDRYLNEAGDSLKQTETAAYVGFPVLAVLLLVTFVLLTGRVVRPIAEAASLAEALSRGVLTQRGRTNGFGEVSRVVSSLNDVAGSLTEFNRRILDGVQVLTASATQIGGTASQLFGSASQTVSAVRETTAIVHEMERTATVVNEKARSVADQSRHSDAIAGAGTRSTKETVQKMTIIKEKMEIVSGSVVTLSENTKFVEHIIAAVQDLADQSNLLAVNASIEAARAGEHGKGFAVVAHEIKSLADQSRDATARVSKILQEIRKSVSSVVMATEEGAKAVQSGLEQSEAAGKSIDELAGSIKEFSEAAGVIFSSSDQQFSRVARVSTAMKDVETATSQSMEGTTHLETEARKLEDLGHTLKELVQQFKLQRSGEM